MNDTARGGWTYLQSYLAPLRYALDRADVTDVYVNRPRELWIETIGGAIERHDVPELDAALLERLARQIAAYSHQGISREHPLLSASLPGGERVQIIAPPATRQHLALAIRKNVTPALSLADYEQAGAFDEVHIKQTSARSVAQSSPDNEHPQSVMDVLTDSVRARRNILVSGGTSTGKTTFLNALIREIPAHERLILIEDTPEVLLSHSNAVGLLAVRGTLGEAQVSADDLVSASLRMRPDRILLGELRGVEAYAFLRAVNTGHPGSMTTIHADSAEGAIEQLVLLILQGGAKLTRFDIQDYVRSTIDVFVQLSRSAGRRYVSEVRTNPRLSKNLIGKL
ncbi:P-type DNA transfer ATPase VirB11 [Sphingomonas prati]|uniref:Type IV secretion system protein n=1 Tax=Sphingomonas prati TaxID=1843237 RepID=A0A7W9BVV8_9SPHN|nr:P-type DNA transfer ATPase VirB11 [Sphingomonas prati]MBB5730960.1 type IV secretion system protein VirB11 [Sphingomonas prati]GGE98015.1 P-type DNA transfer ATPase VirB11 [Sphingomonas prati]